MSKNHLTTDQIIQGCRQKKRNCQRALVDSYSEQLFTICLRYCGDEQKARDILQDTFIRIFKSFKSFDPEKGSLQSWVRKITVNMALKSFRKNKVEANTLSIELTTNLSIEPTAIEKMQAEDLMKIVRTLPEGYRQVFNLSVIEGYNHKEIGKMLGIAEVSSRSNLSRAKHLLRKKLRELSKKNELWARII